MSDQDKFNEEAETKPAENWGELRIITPMRAPEGSTPSSNEKSHAGTYTQYSENGPGFSFCAATQKHLPPGIYQLRSINNQMTFVKEDFPTDKLLRLPDTRSTELVKEIENFWTLKKEFKEGNAKAYGGFLHKRGYLLFGPPGSGKTSTVGIVIEEIIKRNGIVIDGSVYADALSSMLKFFREVEPDRNVLIILEDFDALIARQGESNYLSILDGEGSIDGALFLATTNYPQRFEPRIYNRPGRFSDVVYIGMPSPESRRMYLESKLKDHSDIKKIVALTEGFSIDHLRSIVLGVYFEKKPLEGEIERLRRLFKPPKEDPNKWFGIKNEL